MSGTLTTQLYSCLKASEGGLSQKEAVDYLKNELGVRVKKHHSPYVGQYGLSVTATLEQHEKVEKFLFG